MSDDEEVRRELERVAYSDASSGRGLIAKTTALRALERLNRPQGKKEPPPCPPDWHPQPGSLMEELDAVDPNATPEMRRQWFKRLWEAGELDEDGYYIAREADLRKKPRKKEAEIP